LVLSMFALSWQTQGIEQSLQQCLTDWIIYHYLKNQTTTVHQAKFCMLNWDGCTCKESSNVGFYNLSDVLCTQWTTNKSTSTDGLLQVQQYDMLTICFREIT
jgi:hypothetical protein